MTDMSQLFYARTVSGANKFNGDISKWDVSAVTTMQGMFNGASAFNGDISKWDVSSVTNMGFMFSSASSFNRDLSKWDVSSVKDMSYMFKGATSFAQTLCGALWTDSQADKTDMFLSSKGKIGSTASECPGSYVHTVTTREKSINIATTTTRNRDGKCT